MENKENKNQQKQTSEDVVDKVASGERVSLGDEPLTPEKKMQAEQERMKNQNARTETRHETDRQRSSLGDKVLTPQEKSDRDRMNARPLNSAAKAHKENKK